MRVGRRTAATVLAGAFVLVAACSGDDEPQTRPPEAFCQASIDLEAYGPVRGRTPELDDQIELVREVAATAPPEIEEEAQVFLDAMERYRDGDDSVVDDPEIQEAVNDLNRFATNGCELFERNSGGGSPF